MKAILIALKRTSARKSGRKHPINSIAGQLLLRGIEPKDATAHDLRRACQRLARRIGIIPTAELILEWNQKFGRRLGSSVEFAPEWVFDRLDAALAAQDRQRLELTVEATKAPK